MPATAPTSSHKQRHKLCDEGLLLVFFFVFPLRSASGPARDRPCRLKAGAIAESKLGHLPRRRDPLGLGPGVKVAQNGLQVVAPLHAGPLGPLVSWAATSASNVTVTLVRIAPSPGKAVQRKVVALYCVTLQIARNGS